jgi:hypothetical protein
MNSPEKPFGGRLYEELKKLSAASLLSADYATIQRLKQADRPTTVKMFYGSGYETIQRLKTDEPEAVARYLVSQAKASAGAVASILLTI